VLLLLLKAYIDASRAAADNRILELLDLSQSTSANKRHHLTVYAMQTIAAHPILGDYASYKPGYYSHNVLSAWVDLGLFGFVYLLAIPSCPHGADVLRRVFFAPPQRRNSSSASSLPASPSCCCSRPTTSPTC
jgi:hypothetical protein